MSKTNKAIKFFAEYFKISEDEAKSCHDRTIDCRVKFSKIKEAKEEALLPVDGDLCHNCKTKMNCNKVEIEVGDKTGSVASVCFNYCDECGSRGKIEWFD